MPKALRRAFLIVLTQKKTAAQKSTAVFDNTNAIQPVGSLGLAGSDQAHLVDLVCVAATRQVVDGSVQALQDGAVSSIAAQTPVSYTHLAVYKRQVQMMPAYP